MSILMKGKIKMKYDDKFNAIYEVMSEIEGGYSNSSIDLGGETNYGITHTTFDNWNRLKRRPMRDIKSLTHEEAKEILYEMYYKASGADKLDDWRDSLVLFDNAVQYGDVNARRMFKQAGNNIYQMYKDRLNIYEQRVKTKPDQQGNLEGWKNRIKLLKKGSDMLVEKGYYKPKNNDMVTPFDNEYEGLLKKVDDITLKQKNKTRESARNEFLYRIDKQGIPTGYATNVPQNGDPFTREQIARMTSDEFSKNEGLIMEQLRQGLIKETKPDYSNFTNPLTKRDKIYTREDIDKMSTKEYSLVEKEINAQMQSIGIPYERELPKQSGTKSRANTYKNSTEGKWVTINGNHVLIDK